MSNYILAIESSCDDTSIAIVKNGNEVINMLTHSQIKDFKDIGGVVPEAAARLHINNFDYLLLKIFENTEITMKDINAIAVCNGPGLPGALLVGVMEAKTLAYLYKIPLIEVNHLIAHIASVEINEKAVVFPAIALIISGGHTEIRLLQSYDDYIIIGKTEDDAVGESFDKIAKMMKLPYPGGPEIEKLAKMGNANIKLPFPKTQNQYDFSLSGLKTKCFEIIKSEKYETFDIAASFQKQILDIIEERLSKVIEKYEYKTLIATGGVIANTYLRKNLKQKFPEIIFPMRKYANDNGAMIGVVGYHKFKNQNFASQDLNIKLREKESA